MGNENRRGERAAAREDIDGTYMYLLAGAPGDFLTAPSASVAGGWADASRGHRAFRKASAGDVRAEDVPAGSGTSISIHGDAQSWVCGTRCYTGTGCAFMDMAWIRVDIYICMMEMLHDARCFLKKGKKNPWIEADGSDA